MNKLIPLNILTYFTLLDGERFFYHVDGSSTRGGSTVYVRPRTGPQPAHLWWPAVATVQAASVPIA